MWSKGAKLPKSPGPPGPPPYLEKCKERMKTSCNKSNSFSIYHEKENVSEYTELQKMIKNYMLYFHLM